MTTERCLTLRTLPGAGEFRDTLPEVSDQINISSALTATENVLRDLIALKLEQKFGAQWQDHLGVTNERLEKWRDRIKEEAARLSTGNLETRLLYFADFTDIKTVILKNWDLFADVFGEKRQFDVLISMLENFRNPEAHRRGLLPFQEQLAAGICGEIRTRVARYRSRLETSDDCFPRIESAFDNHGQVFPKPQSGNSTPVLRVGDRIEISVLASDPEGRPLNYKFNRKDQAWMSSPWQTGNTFSLELEEKQIGKGFYVAASIQSDRTYHADGDKDDGVIFGYIVLPNR